MPEIIKIHIEGFVSIISKINYKFNRPGVNLILGRNGVGKTTIFNALAWVLYGQVLKNKSSVAPWPHIIDENYRGTKVRVELDEGYEVIRCSEFKGKILGNKGGNRLLILKDGKELKNLKGKIQAQAWINVYLGYSFQLFKTSVLFAQELNSLIEEDGPTKKKTFDEAFQSAFINKAKDNVESELSQLILEHGKITDKLDAKDELLKNNRELLESLETQIRKFATDKALQILELRRKIKNNKKEANKLKEGKNISVEKRRLRKEAKELDDQINSLANGIDKTLEKEYIILTKDLEGLVDKLKACDLSLEYLRVSDKPICNVCGQKLNGKKLKTYEQKRKRKRTELKEQRKGIVSMTKFTSKRIEDARVKLQDQSSIEEEIQSRGQDMQIANDRWHKLNIIDTKLKAIRKAIRVTKQEISRIRRTKLTNNTEPIKENIIRFEKEREELYQQNKNIEEQMGIKRWLIKDPLSNSGLKAFIFDSMLNKVNYYLKYYKKYTGFEVRVGMDLESSNKDFMISIIKGGDEVPYYDFSKGQKQLAKVVLCFALNDSIDAAKPLNIMLMDELFESLDPENIEVVSSIIMAKAKNKSIHLISHKSAFNPTQCSKLFLVLNDKNQTVIQQKYKEA